MYNLQSITLYIFYMFFDKIYLFSLNMKQFFIVTFIDYAIKFTCFSISLSVFSEYIHNRFFYKLLYLFILTLFYNYRLRKVYLRETRSCTRVALKVLSVTYVYDYYSF